MSNHSPKPLWQSLDTTGKMVFISLILLTLNTGVLILFVPTILKVNSVATKIESVTDIPQVDK